MAQYTDPTIATNAFFRTAGGLQDLRDARQGNAMRQMQMDEQNAINALRRNPNATAEQLVRGGDIAGANALTGISNNQINQSAALQKSRQDAIANIAPIAAHALTIQDPAARKSYIKNAVPVFAEDFKALGSNVEEGLGKIDAMPDQQLADMLSQVAQLARPVDAAPVLTQQQGPHGSTIVTYGRTMNVVEPPRPQQVPNSYRQLTPAEVASAGLPAGTSAQVDSAGKVDVISKRDNTAALSQKDQMTARSKLNSLALAKQQLGQIKEAFEAGRQGVNAFGPGQGMLPTEAGKLFDARVDQMRGTLTSLTRVPGVGSMSDYESKIDQGKFPNRNDYESVTADKIAQLENMLSLIERGYTDMLGQQPQDQAQQPAQPQQSAQNPPQAQGGPQVGVVEDGYKFLGGDPRDPRAWRKVQ